MKQILIVGSGAREHALAYSLHRSQSTSAIYCIGSAVNPAVRDLCAGYTVGDITDGEYILETAKDWGIELAVIGPEAPLSTGVADILRAGGIDVFGPDEDLARIETSKSYTRDLLSGCVPDASPVYRVVRTHEEAETLLEELGEFYVIKADGLKGGKGVQVAGDHLHSHGEALSFVDTLLSESGQCVIEEKLIGQEFSLMTITDGETSIHLPAVQDHKRAFNGDTGPNTGGMGSYSDHDGSLPFLEPEDIEEARRLNEAVIAALAVDNGKPYRGVLYGGFMAVKEGVKIIEYNARFGDPEVMNLVSIIQADFVELFSHAADGTLSEASIEILDKASVCKYVVPNGYPSVSNRGAEIDISEVDDSCRLFLGSVDLKDGVLVTGGSRTAACIALGETIEEAERIAEAQIGRIRGDLFHRDDIGTSELVASRVKAMRELRS